MVMWWGLKPDLGWAVSVGGRTVSSLAINHTDPSSPRSLDIALFSSVSSTPDRLIVGLSHSKSRSETVSALFFG